MRLARTIATRARAQAAAQKPRRRRIHAALSAVCNTSRSCSSCVRSPDVSQAEGEREPAGSVLGVHDLQAICSRRTH